MSGRQMFCITWIILYSLSLSNPVVYARNSRHLSPEIRAQGWVNTDRHSSDFTLKNLRGHVVVLLFFVANDRYSEDALEQAQRLWNAYHHRGVEVIGVHCPAKGWQFADRTWRTIDLPDSIGENMNPAQHNVHGRQRRYTPLIGYRGHAHIDLKDHIRRHWQRRNHAPLKRLAEERRLPFPILLDHDRYVWTKYRIHAYPTFQLIGADGTFGPRIVGSKAYHEVSRTVDVLLRERHRP